MILLKSLLLKNIEKKNIKFKALSGGGNTIRKNN